MYEKVMSRTQFYVDIIIPIFIALISANTCTGVHTNSGYLVLAPAIFRSGVKQSITVRILEEREPVPVTATLVDSFENSILASAKSTVQGNGRITLEVPKNVDGKALLRICGNCHRYTGFRFQNETVITIKSKGASAFIQSDKPIYKPSQIVRINVYTVDRDLRPVTENVTVYVKAPNDVKIMEWRHVVPTCGGTVELSFPLSDQPPEGKWTVFAEMQGSTFNTTFRVSKYVLPKFDVTIIPPPTFRDWSTCETVTVVARYPFGKPVKGRLTVNITVRGDEHLAERFDKRVMNFNGEARFCVRLQEVVVDTMSRGRSLSRQRDIEANLAISATVISEDGGTFSAYDDTAIVSRNYVDFEFTAATRKYFKQGIPFQGEIAVTYMNGTPADNVAIELKAKLSRQTFVVQNLVTSSGGLVQFTIPPISDHADVMALEARVSAIDGRPTNRLQYVTKSFYLENWYSPSQCFVSIEKPDQNTMVNHRIEFKVKSTCICDFTLYYDLLSRGDIILSESLTVNSSNSHFIPNGQSSRFIGHNRPGDHLCQTSITLTPTSAMAPLAKLLVYYVRPNGEGVADSIQVELEPELENKLQIDVTKRIFSPGEKVPVTVRTGADSCVCMGATDKSLHYLSRDYLLNEGKVFEEMYTYDLSNSPFEEVRIRHDRLHRRKRWRPWHRRSLHGFRIQTRDSMVAFLETGLVVMTDIVALNHRDSTELRTGKLFQAITGQGHRKIPRKSRKLRAFFPETWYWKCFKVGLSGEKSLTLHAPDSITSWVFNAVGINEQSGIGVAENVEVHTRKRFFIAFNMPYSAIRGEELDLPVTIHNYLDSCTLVRLAVKSQSGVSFPNSRSARARGIVKYLCVDGNDTVTTTIKMVFSELGNASVLAVADGVHGPNACCGVNKKIANNQKEINASDEVLRGSVIGADALLRHFIVEPEGERREYVHSVFFCPNEKMNITTTPSKFHFINFDNKTNSFNFLVKAANNVHIVLANSPEKTDTSYEIILGGGDNTRSWIQLNDQILGVSTTRNILSQSEARSFWIQWDNQRIKVGYGMEEDVAATFLTLPVSSPVRVKSIGLGTSGQSPAEFRLWSREGFGMGFHEVFQLDVPKYTIPDSVKGRASIIGDVMGPTLKNLNNLLKLPHGCGEQNMINFAPNIHILKYLKTTNQLTSDILNTARDYLVQGYQRQLTYRRRNGSYSAFGNNDEYGSMWLTAFVMKSYAQAKEFIYVDQREIDEPLRWIINQQMSDGSFPAHGRIMNKKALLGINKTIPLTAYVVIAISETGSTNQEANEAVERAMEYLQAVPMANNDPYTAALLAYALTLAGNGLAEEARRILLDKSIVKYSGSYRYWPLRDVYGEDSFIFSPSSKQTVVSAEIELASYALLAYTESNDVSIALPIVRWISKQRNPQGGFASTQDTCVALQALSSYASFAYMGGVNLNITFGGDYTWNVHLNDRNSEILQRGDLPSITENGTSVFVEATGDGCALLQINVQYNMPDSEDGNNFAITMSMTKVGRTAHQPNEVASSAVSPDLTGSSFSTSQNTPVTSSEKQIFEVKVCGRWLKHGSTNMAVLEFPLLTGFVVDTETLPQDTSDKSKSMKKIEIGDSVVNFYFDEMSSDCKTCITFRIRREYDVDEPSPKYLKLYDYYEPGYESSISYDIHGVKCTNGEGCEATDAYPECSCYRECGFAGERICGNDSNIYENQCRMSMKSCEIGASIIPHKDKQGCYKTVQEEIYVPEIIYGYDGNEEYGMSSSIDLTPDYISTDHPEAVEGEYMQDPSV